MDHPYEVGEIYRNRLGEYEVISIEGDRMVIRYEDGGEAEVDIAIQQRIQSRMSLEESIRKERQRKQRRKARQRSNFEGFSEGDFKDGVIGTSWRRRGELGGLLSNKLSGLSGRNFQSRAVPRQPRLHIYQEKVFDSDESEAAAKFEVQLNEIELRHGFYIEKKAGEMDEAWDWPYFLEALKEDASLWQTAEVAMERYGLHWHIQTKTEDDEADETLIVQLHEGTPMLSIDPEKEPQPIEWGDIVDELEDIPQNQRCELYIEQIIPKDEAIDKGIDINEHIAAIWNALLPIYIASVRR